MDYPECMKHILCSGECVRGVEEKRSHSTDMCAYRTFKIVPPCDRWLILIVNLTAAGKQAFEHTYGGRVSRLGQPRWKDLPQCEWYHSMGWDSKLNKYEKGS